VHALQQAGRVERYLLQLRKPPNEEFTMSVSEVAVPWRSETVILAVGTVVREASL
jgi:hypothetical protein